MSSPDREVRVSIAVANESDASSLELELASAGGEDVDVAPEGAGVVDPITLAVVGSIVVSATIQAAHFGVVIARWWRNRNKPGIVIDARNEGSVAVTESAHLDRGQVITIGADGHWAKHLDTDPNGLEDYVPKVLEGLPSGGTPTSPGELGSGAGAG